MQKLASRHFPRLVGDIGGTNIRLAVITAAGEAPAQIRSFACSSFPGLDAAILHYLATEHLALPPVAAFGIATPLAGDAVRMTNRAWAFSIEALRVALKDEAVVSSLATMGLTATPSSPEEMLASQRANSERWAPLIKKIGFTAES